MGRFVPYHPVTVKVTVIKITDNIIHEYLSFPLKLTV